MREKFQRFMMGRYGTDDLGKFTLYAAVVLYILNLFLRNRGVSSLITIVVLLGLYRMLSRDHGRRYQENIKFLNWKNKVVSKFRRSQSNLKQRKTHHIYRCPTCRQKIRIPKGKGRICITCPKCKTEFTKIS